MKILINKVLIYLAVFGPATITAMADNDAAGVATYSLAGAKFGYSILFILFLVTILLAITQEMGARIALRTGKGLGDLIRERYGIRISVVIFLMLFVANMGTIIANMSAIKVTSSLFQIPSLPLIIFIIIVSYIFIQKGSYHTNQKIFLLSSLFYIAYIISAIKSNPDWGMAVKSLFVPTQVIWSKDFIFASIAILGTTITPWGQFFINSYILDKKLTINKLRYEQIETFLGALLTDFFSFFMIVATAATLYLNKIPLLSGEQASLAIRPFAGDLASLLFGLGILNAGFMGIIIVSLSTAYAFSEFFGYTGSLDAPFNRGKLFYSLFLLQLILAAVFVLLPSVSLFRIVFYTQSLNGILLPVILFFLLKITNDRNLMGEYVNNRFYNYFIIISSVLIIMASLLTIFGSII